MSGPLFTEGEILKCTQTFDYNGKSVPAGKKYKIIESETVPIDEDKPHVVEGKITLKIQDKNVPDRVCRNPVVIGDDISDHFKPEGWG